MRLTRIIFLSVVGLSLILPWSSQAGGLSALPASGVQLAQNDFDYYNSANSDGGSIRTKEDVVRVVNRAINILFGSLLLLAVLFLLIAAYHFLFGGDDSGRIETAKTMIRYTIIAILVGGLSRVIVALTLYLIGL
mgnify:CR=1 FL=1